MSFRGVKQHDIRDCGPACFATVCLHYGLKVPLVNIREEMHVDKNGVNLLAIIKTAQKYNFESEALHGNWAELEKCITQREVELPLIVHGILEDALAHFWVILKIQKDKVYLFDPAKGRVVYSIKEFCEFWTGYIITFKRNREFIADNLKKGYYRKFSVIITEQKRFFLGVILMSLLFAGISIANAFIYRGVVDHFIMRTGTVSFRVTIPFINPDSLLQLQIANLLSNIDRLFCALIILCIVQAILQYARSVYLAKISKKSVEILMYSYFKHLLLLPLSFFLDRETGEVLSRFKDIEEIQNIISSSTLTLVLDSFILIAAIAVLISIDYILFLLILLIICAYAFVVIAYRKTIAKLSRKTMEYDAVSISKFKEALDGIETIKSTSQEKYFYEEMKKKTGHYISTTYKSNLVGASQGVILLIVDSIGITCVLWLGSKFVIEGIITLGSLVVFVTLMQFLISPAQRLIGLQPEIQQAIIAAERLNDVLEVSKTKEDFCNENDLKSNISFENKPIIFDNVSFSYGYRDLVLKNLSFTINPGEKIAIVGANGSGKTTILHLLDAFYKPTSGIVSLGEMPVTSAFVDNIRNKVSYVSQNAILFTGSIKENITFGIKDYTESELYDIVKNCRIDEISIKSPFGLNSFVHESGKNLSGGQRQRIMIARALLSNPDILLFDECTSQVDSLTENIIIDYITRKYSNKICIFVTHRMNIIDMCDKVLFLKGNMLSGFDSHDTLMTNNKDYCSFINGGNR